jgi:hypothetical protein
METLPADIYEGISGWFQNKRRSMEPDAGSRSLRWWTLSQRIGTFAEMPFEAELLEAETAPRYQQIAKKVLHLNQLGLTNEAIVRHIGVDGKTVAKALSWIRNGH